MKSRQPSAPAPALLEFDLTDEDQALFLAETDELIQRLEESLVDLERSPHDQGLLQEIFRAAHTIKGSAATIGHARMAALTHTMETRLDDVRKGAAPVTPALIEALLTALDVLKGLRDEVETRRLTNLDVDGAVASLETAATMGAAPPPGAAGLAPEPPPAPSAGPAAPSAAAETSPSGPPATHRLQIRLEPGPWAAVRALQVLLALAEQGCTVVSSEPSQAEIEREDAPPPEAVVVLLRTTDSDAQLHTALERVPELGAVSIETLSAPSAAEPEPSARREGADAEPVPAARSRPSQGGPSAAASSPRPDESRAAASASKTVRIDVARLDALLNLVGELVIDRTRLLQLGNQMANRLRDDRLVADFHQTAVHIGRITDELQEQVMKSRMLPVETVFNRLPRVVRDLAAKLGKQVTFVVDGQDTELDRSVIEEIGDPLVHLIRNALDHGLETPEVRRAAGKPAEGQLHLTAEHAENHILIALHDDGRGIPTEVLKAKALERGLISADQAERMTDHEAVQLIFHPGLSTARTVSDISGRGVGMDVVRANVEKLNGSIDVRTQRGEGTTFVIRLPLTLAILQALLVRVAGEIYAVPIHTVTETFRVEAHQVQRINRREVMQLRGTILPLVALREAFGVDAAGDPAIGADTRLVVAVNAAGNRQAGLIVDGLVGEQEIVIKPLGQYLGDLPGLSGAAILGDGSVALIVDASALIEHVAGARGAAPPQGSRHGSLNNAA